MRLLLIVALGLTRITSDQIHSPTGPDRGGAKKISIEQLAKLDPRMVDLTFQVSPDAQVAYFYGIAIEALNREDSGVIEARMNGDTVNFFLWPMTPEDLVFTGSGWAVCCSYPSGRAVGPMRYEASPISTVHLEKGKFSLK